MLFGIVESKKMLLTLNASTMLFIAAYDFAFHAFSGNHSLCICCS